MKSIVAFVSLALIGSAAIWAQNAGRKAPDRVAKGQKAASTKQATGAAHTSVSPNPATRAAVEKGAKWLASVQGTDGGWGQDGGDSSHVRQAVNLESTGNDVANTALAALALLRAGDQYRSNVERAVDFILRRVESSPAEGLSVTDVNAKQTQVQRKLGPHIDTFLAAMLLAQVDGSFAEAANRRIRSGLEKCVAKIERNQTKDGSWNAGGGWAPLLGTSLASRSLYEAQKKGLSVDREVMARADAFTVKNQQDRDSMARAGVGAGSLGGVGSGRGAGGVAESVAVSSAAGVALYQDAQALEQLSRTPESREKNAKEIAAINSKLSDAKFVEGYGSVGGEEFFSYLNISDSLRRSGGKEWSEWHSNITQKILKLQNNDGTWAGHHCITGRCAVTNAAILNLTSDRGI